MTGARLGCGWLAIAAVLGGCAGKAMKAEDAAAPDTATKAAPDDIEARAQELDAYEAQLRALGLGPAHVIDDGTTAQGAGESHAEATSDAPQLGSDRCARICTLAEAICGIEASVCALADEHPGEARYAEVCTRAREDCELASSACDGCER